MLKVIIIIIQICLIGFAQDSGEKYITKEVAFIPYGEVDSLPGLILGGPERNEQGEIVHVEPGEAVRSWDIGLDGKIYLADGVKRRVSVYDSNGHYLRSIGVWDQDTNEITVRAISGKEIIVRAYQPWKYYIGEGRRQTYLYPFKTYFKYPADIAVDGAGNVYVIPSLSANYLMKFSPDGKLLEIIDKFGEYGPEDMKMGIGQVFSDAYGNVFVDVSLKSTYIFAKLNEKGKLLSITEKKIYPQDANGNLYEMLPDGKGPSTPDTNVSLSIRNSKGVKTDAFTIYFERPTSMGVGFRGVDGNGNIYLDVGYSFHKYDQKGNLLARIYPSTEFAKGMKEKYTFKISLAGMAAVSKIMADGSIYNVELSDQGVIVYKMSIKPGTKGQILKPAVKPEKN